jgi:hypothetical protein
MTRKPKLPKPRKIRRNPMALALRAGAKYQARVVAKVGTYRRRPKHKRAPGEEPGD